MTDVAECPTCQGDPNVAPGRYCAPKRCLCRHTECPAYLAERRQRPRDDDREAG